MSGACPTCGAALSADAPGGQCPACLLALLGAAPAPAPAGERFGEYELGPEIARGAMGRVVEARHVRLGRTVALKMIHAGKLASPELAARFRLEFGVAARLDHPHIVPVYEAGEHDGVLFFSMRRMEGGSLRDRIDTFAGRPRAAARLLVEVARAVHHAHQRGVIHRDLKPANILLDGEGRAFVADFGLAKLSEQDSGLSHTGAVLGSPGYMAPEQARGDLDQVSTASDLYGLGAILYHLLCGRPPHQADTALATLRRVMDEEPVAPARLNPRVDRDLEAIVLRCLEKIPARRYGSADALARDLERWLEGRPIEARPAGPLLRLAKWSRRRPAYAALALLLSSSGVGLFSAALVLQSRHPVTTAPPPEFLGTSVWIPVVLRGPGRSDVPGGARLRLPEGRTGPVLVWVGESDFPLVIDADPDGWVRLPVVSGQTQMRIEW